MNNSISNMTDDGTSHNNTSIEGISDSIIIGLSVSFPALTIAISILCVVYYLRYKGNKKKREREEKIQKLKKENENENLKI